MRNNKTKDSLTWMQGMRMSYEGVERQIDAWLSNILTNTRRQYGKYTVFGILINAFKELCTLIFAQIVVGSKEHNILTAEQTASVRGLAQLACYNTTSAASALGKIALVFDANAASKLGPTVFVKRHAKLKCKENSLFYFIDMSTDYEQLVLNDDNIEKRFEFTCKQGEWKQQQFVASNKPLETFVIEERNALIDCNSIIVEIASTDADTINEVWQRFAGFGEMNRNTEGWVLSWSFEGKPQIMFGNGVTGKMPAENAVITVSYVACDGYDGNVLVKNNVTFEFEDGMFDTNTTSISPKDCMTIKQVVDIVGGYNGDDIETIRANAGAINRALVLHSAASIKAYMSRYGQYHIIDVWSDTQSQIIHIVAVPNIEDKYLNAGTLVYNYWSLPIAEFTLSQLDRQWLQDCVHSNDDYVLLTDLQFDTVALSFYQMYVFCNKKSPLQDEDSIKQAINTAITEFVQDSWRADKLFISRSAAIAAIEKLGIVQSVDVKFIGDQANIDQLGNIASKDKYTMPIIRNEASIEMNAAVKILLEKDGRYCEI